MKSSKIKSSKMKSSLKTNLNILIYIKFKMCKRLITINQLLREYCLASTNDSMLKLVEKTNKERNNLKLDIFKFTKNINESQIQDLNPDPNNNNILFASICILFGSSIVFYYYKLRFT